MIIRTLNKLLFSGTNLPLGKLFPACLFCFILCIQIISANAAQKGQMAREPIFDSMVYIEEHGKQNDLTLVLVHGTGELGATIWDSTIEELKDSFHILTFDLPGFGRSEKKNALYSPAKYARFLNWVIDKKTSEPIYLIGHSLGGAISLYYAGIFPDKLDRLVLVDIAGILHRSSFTKNMLDQQLSGEVKVGKKNIIEKPLSTLKYIVGTTIENVEKAVVPEDIGPLLESKTFRSTALDGNPIRISAMALIHTDFSPILEKVRVPTNIIWGENDAIAPLRVGKLLAYRINKTSLTVLNGLEHNPMLEDPETFNSMLLESIMETSPELFGKIENSKITAEKPISRQFTNQNNLIISGHFKKLTIKNSRNVTLRNLVAQYLEIEDSEMVLENVLVKGKEIGVQINDSIVYLTGVNISADTAIRVFNSNVDIAGSRLTAKRHLIRSERKSTVVFSVCKVQSPSVSGNVHKMISLHLGETF